MAYVTDDARAAVDDAGILCAFTTENRWATPGDDLRSLPRVRISGEYTRRRLCEPRERVAAATGAGAGPPPLSQIGYAPAPARGPRAPFGSISPT